jgi:hypothetical protein
MTFKNKKANPGAVKNKTKQNKKTTTKLAE